MVSDIWKNGLTTPLIGWASNEGQFLLDGRNRLDALAKLSLLYETEDHHVGIKKWTGKEWSDRPAGRIDGADACVWKNFYEGDPYAIAFSFNVPRRMLTNEQKRDLIAKVLKAKPEASNVTIAKAAKADDKTVASVRRELEGRSEIPNVEVRTDTKGRKQPAKKPKPAPKKTAVADSSPTVDSSLTKDTDESAGQRKLQNAALFDKETSAPPEGVAHLVKTIVAKALEIFFAQASGAEILERIPADRRTEVVRGILAQPIANPVQPRGNPS
jgi:hypothetical protein